MELFLQELFIDVVNMSITASYVILFVLVARLFLKKAPKIFSYSLWAVVLFRLVCPFSFSSAFSLLKAVGSNSGNMEYIPPDIGTMAQPQISTGIDVVSSAVNTSLPAAISYSSINPRHIVLFVIPVIWALGIVLLMLYSVISYLILKHKVRTAILVKNNIFQYEGISSPFVLGFIKPRIYLPTGLKEAEQSYILKHEQTHIKRFDYLIKLFWFMALCVHWFNPLVWFSFMLMSKDMEMSCDEQVLKELGTNIKKSYSTSLLSLAVSKKMIKGNPIAFGESNTKARIKNILNYKKPVFWVMPIGIIAVVCISLGLISNPGSNTGIILTEQNDFIKKIYGFRTPYLGDNSKVVNITNNLPVPKTLTHTKVQLFTDKAPYTIEVTYETPSEIQKSFLEKDNQAVFDQNAALIFALIGNVEQVNFILRDDYNNLLIQRTRTWANNNMAKDVWKSSAAIEGFTTLYKEIMNRFITYDSLLVLLTSGKKTNIQSVNDVPNIAKYQKIKANREVYYVYEKSGKYYVEKPYQFINEITEETYKKILFLSVSLNRYEDIQQELSLDAKKYFLKNTPKDSCILASDGVIESGSEIAEKFITDTQNGKNSSIKIIHPRENGHTTFTKVIYDGESYYGVEYDSMFSYIEKTNYYYEFKFKYLKILNLSDYKFVYLLQDNNVTYNDIEKSMISEIPKNSRNSNDQLDFYSLCAFDAYAK